MATGPVRDAVLRLEPEVHEPARVGGRALRAADAVRFGGDEVRAGVVAGLRADLEVVGDAVGDREGLDERAVDRVELAAPDRVALGFGAREGLVPGGVGAEREVERAGLQRLAGGGRAAAARGSGAVVREVPPAQRAARTEGRAIERGDGERA
jgi:hypothetical protein